MYIDNVTRLGYCVVYRLGLQQQK